MRKVPFKYIFTPLVQKPLAVNKSENVAYNKVVEAITVSERSENGSHITYVYNALAEAVRKAGGSEELFFNEERAALRILVGEPTKLRAQLRERIAEVIGVGYKFRYLDERLNVCLSKREKQLLCAALIAADLEGDKAYIRRKLEKMDEYSVDGFYTFRLAPLREKWDRIIRYVPDGFSTADLKQFCDFLVGESKNKIYLKGNTVFTENFTPLRLSRLTGEEDLEMEIILSDAGFVYCLGEVEDSVEDFLQKFYAERAIFS